VPAATPSQLSQIPAIRPPPVQLGLELGDLPDGVLVQVGLELRLKTGQVVAGEALVQFPVAVGGFDGSVKLAGFDRIGVAERRHGRDDSAAELVHAATKLICAVRDLCGGATLGPVAPFRLAWLFVPGVGEQRADRVEVRPGALSCRFIQDCLRALDRHLGAGYRCVHAA
jgi:hypothetical protein